ncbi:hypothetical protein ABD71_22360 [Brevibacillus laterosporus]|nr:hypothetical protein [Brevibacillus laterosporus]
MIREKSSYSKILGLKESRFYRIEESIFYVNQGFQEKREKYNEMFMYSQHINKESVINTMKENKL